MSETWAVILGVVILLTYEVLYQTGFLKTLWKKHKPDALKRKQAERTDRDMKEKQAAISHINGLMEAVTLTKSKQPNHIIKIIDRIGFSELEKNLFLARKYHADFTIPEKESTKRLYLKDWVELLSVGGLLSEGDYIKCVNMAVRYECSSDIIKDIMDELGVKKIEVAKGNCPNSQKAVVPDLSTTNSVVWMAHCVNLPFLPQAKNMEINFSIMSLLKNYEDAVKTGNSEKTNEIFNKIQGLMKEKFGDQINNPMVKALMQDFKICALSKDLLDLYKMVIEGQQDEEVLSGKGAIRRILKYSIELGSPAKTLDSLTNFFVNNPWFAGMQDENEWLKLALECMMVTGNGELGDKILERLQSDGGISEEEKEELLGHAREFRSQIDVSWM